MAFALFAKRRISAVVPVNTFILQDTNTIKYYVFIDSNGVLQTRTGAAGTVSNIKVTGGSAGEASFNISTSGELQVVSAPAGGETLNDDYRIRSLSGAKVFRIKVSVNNELQTEEV